MKINAKALRLSNIIAAIEDGVVDTAKISRAFYRMGKDAWKQRRHQKQRQRIIKKAERAYFEAEIVQQYYSEVEAAERKAAKMAKPRKAAKRAVAEAV